MARPNVPISGPVPEEEMLRMLAITRVGDDDDPVFPDVDDKKELKVGAVVFVTVYLTKPNSEEKTQFALPGIVHDEGEGMLAVRPLPTKLWEQGWAEVKSVPVEDASLIRFCSFVKELNDDQLIADHYEDGIGEVIESCGEDLLLKDKAFKQWMGGKAKNPNFKLDRWQFLRAVAERMATELSITAWKLRRPPSFDTKKDVPIEEAKWFDTEFIAPVLADKCSSMTDEAEKTKFKAAVTPNATATAKYLTMLMDILSSEDGPSPAVKKKAGGGSDCSSEVDELAGQVKELKETISILTGAVNAIATHLKIRAATDDGPKADAANDDDAKDADAYPADAEPEAEIVDISGDEHECAYHAMSVAKAVNDGTMQPSGKPTFSDDAVDAARLAVTMHAKRASEADPEGFKALLGFTVQELWQQVMAPTQDEKTWPGEHHFVLHAPEHPDVHLKIKAFREGKLITWPTRQENLPQAKMVMFAHWRPGHFDLIGFQGKFAFTQGEVAAAELAVDKLLAKGTQPMNSLNDDEFESVVKAALAANRVKLIPPPRPVSKPTPDRQPENGESKLKPSIKSVTWAPSPAGPVDDLEAASTASLETFARHQEMIQLRDQLESQSLQMHAQTQLEAQTRKEAAALEAQLLAKSADSNTQAAAAASLVSFAHEEKMRQLRDQMDAQSKQMQAQAQLGLQARQKVSALEAKLQSQQQGGRSGSPTPHQQQAPPTHQAMQQGAGAVDMILNGSVGAKPVAQTALVIYSNEGKKRIEKALDKLDAIAFKAVQSITKLDANTPAARHIVLALAHDVPTVRLLLVPLTAAGMRVDLQDRTPTPSSASTWTQVVAGGPGKNKKHKRGGLAGLAQAGLTNAIGKAGQANFKRVHGQCDYYSARLDCPRGAACKFTCYNGPGQP